MGLIHWWPLNNSTTDYGTKPLALIEENGVAFTGTGKVTSVGATYLSTNQWSRLKATDLGTITSLHEYSLACWIYLTGTGAYNTTIMFLSSGNFNSSGQFITFGLSSYNSTNGYTVLNVPNKTSCYGGISLSGDNCIQLNKWYHITITYKDEVTTGYINGKVIGTYPGSMMMTNSTYPFYYIGAATYYADFTTRGVINDFRIYDHALSQAEVRELSKGLTIHYDFNYPGTEATTNEDYNAGWSAYGQYWTIASRDRHNLKIYRHSTSTNTVLALSNSTLLSKMAIGDVWTFSCYLYKEGKPYQSAVKEMSNYASFVESKVESRADGFFRVTFTMTANAQGKKDDWIIHQPIFGSIGTDVYCELRNMQFEKKDHPTAYTKDSREARLWNSAGFVQPSSLTTLTLTESTMSGSYAANFDGKTSCIDTPALKPDMFTSDYTINFWVYPLDDGRAVYFGDYTTTNSSNINFERNAGGAFRYYHNGSPDSSFSGANAPVNTWTMLSVTYSTTDKKLRVYKNGALAGSIGHTATLQKNLSSIMRIGRDSRSGTNANDSGNTALQGYMDDFRFYVTCLSDKDIQDLYRVKARISDQGDILTGMFAEGQARAGVTEKATFNSTQSYEELSSEYEMLDSILFTRDEYIDTGVVFNDPSLPIYVGGEATATITSGNICLAGCGNANWSGPVMFNFCGGKLEFGTGIYSTISTQPGLFAANERLTVSAEINTTTQKWYKNGQHINGLKNGTFVASPASLYIGTFHTKSGSTDTTVGSNNSFNGYVHRFWISYGDIHRYFLPARRKKDGVLGMYELVGKQFYTTPTGSFSAGAVLSKGSASIYEAGHISGRNLIEN